MMQQLRNSTKWIMILVAVAFVGLMVFEWGMDISGRSAGSLGEIGRVNGTGPSSTRTTRPRTATSTSRRRPFRRTPSRTHRTRRSRIRAWDEIVRTILIEQELERRGIVVTDEEIRSAALFSPPPELVQNPVFQTDGQFDLARYQDWVAGADRNTLLGLEAMYRELIPRGKLARQVGTGVHVSDSELWDLYRQEYDSASVSFVSFEPLTRVADDQIEITGREISDYYRENRESFFMPASARVVSAYLTKAPTPADTAAVLATAGELRQSILDGEDFAEVAMRESIGPAAGGGGDLGVVARGAMVPRLDSAVFSARTGRVTEPILTSFGVHLLEVSERWSQDSAHVHQIVLDIARTEDSEFELFDMADSLEVLGESMPLAEAATILGLEADTSDILETRPFVPGAGDVAEGGEWIFDPVTSLGDVSPVFENRLAFYALELVSSESGNATRPKRRPSRRSAGISASRSGSRPLPRRRGSSWKSCEQAAHSWKSRASSRWKCVTPAPSPGTSSSSASAAATPRWVLRSGSRSERSRMWSWRTRTYS